jgi:hypothetical protein
MSDGNCKRCKGMGVNSFRGRTVGKCIHCEATGQQPDFGTSVRAWYGQHSARQYQARPAVTSGQWVNAVTTTGRKPFTVGEKVQARKWSTGACEVWEVANTNGVAFWERGQLSGLLRRE